MRILRFVFAFLLIATAFSEASAFPRRRDACLFGRSLTGYLNRFSSLILWYEGDYVTVDGISGVSAIKDLSRSRNNASQPTASLRPQLLPALGGPGPDFTDIIYFDGTDDYLSFSPILNFGTSFTVAWTSVFVDFTFQRPILGYSGGAMNRIAHMSDTTTGIIYTNGLSFTFSHANINDGLPHHFIMTSDDDLYVDGVAASRAGTEGTGLSFDMLGGNGAVQYFMGVLDDVSVFNKPLTKAEKNLVGNFLEARNGGTWTDIP